MRGTCTLKPALRCRPKQFPTSDRGIFEICYTAIYGTWDHRVVGDYIHILAEARCLENQTVESSSQAPDVTGLGTGLHWLQHRGLRDEG